MSPSESVQRAIEMLEQQIADLSGIRNATARDPSFKNWRQATVTAMQRIWPGDQTRSERFRRIPFSPADPRADHRAVREQYSRGCQEAGRVLNGFLDEIRDHGVPELSDEPLPVAPEAEFEDGFPTLDLPAGEAPATGEPSRLAEHLLDGLGDEPPQGKDPSFADPARLPVAAPVAATPQAPAPAKKGPGMKARLRDLLGFAQLSAKSLAGFPRENNPPAPPDAMSPGALGITPLGEDVGSLPGMTPITPASPVETAPAAPLVEAASDVPADWPLLPRRAVADVEPHAQQSPWPATLSAAPAAPAEPPVAAVPVAPPTPIAIPAPAVESPVPPAAAIPPPAASLPAEPVVPAPASEESASVIMSRPTTLRGTIDKVSIESLISPEFRASSGEEGAPAPGRSLNTTPEAPPSESIPSTHASASAATAAAPSAPEAHPAAPSAPAPSAPATENPPPVSRPSLTLVRPLLDDPEFNVDPTPKSELPPPSADAPVSALAPRSSRAAGKRAAAATPKPAPPPAAPHAEEADAFDHDESTSDSDVDPEEFAKAADEFMRSSPVLGASTRRAARAQDLSDFGDPDAIAVASMAQDLTRMEVPRERHAEVRARLMDLARRLERGELEWSALRKAVWFAMEYPELARRLMPVLLPWIDRAA